MLRLAKNSGLHPSCLTIKDVQKLGEEPITYGGFGVVWKGNIGKSDVFVCLKIVKIETQSDQSEEEKTFLREAILWRMMKHPNVLPFLGIYYDGNASRLCLISPWMERGNLRDFLKRTERKAVGHYTLVYDVAEGLSYLHSKDVVHGDLKGANILITPSGRASIGDFGLSRVTELLHLTASTPRSGTVRWSAPELLKGAKTTKESDIYAYGCVCYEIFTGQYPFPEYPLDGTVINFVLQGKHCARPPQSVSELHDFMWKIMETCWNKNSSDRPNIQHIIHEVRLNIPNLTAAQSDWNDCLSAVLWSKANGREPPIPPPAKGWLRSIF
ncbi:kinase-like protein [Marasmius fiardii PR-910]|nr:kinase-like protein [Marasmius fiardii PR-910]